MSAEKEAQSPPPLESDDDEVQEGSFSSAADAVPPTSAQPGATTATPSNTPVTSSMFTKVPHQSTATKRSFEGVEAKAAPKNDSDKVKDMLDKLRVSDKNAPVSTNNRDPEDEAEVDDEADDDEDGDDEDEDYEEDQHVATKEQMDAVVPLLRENQAKLSAVQEEYQRARRELEIKFQELRSEHMKERDAIIKGSENDGIALPGFWLDAMQRNSLLSQFVEEWDEAALIFLDSVTVEELADAFGYKLNFHFSKNPFFTNEVLTKTLTISNFYTDASMPDIDESVGTEINWIPERDLTVKIEVVKQKQAGRRGGKKGGQTKEIRQELPRESFFNYFKSRTDAADEELAQMNQEQHDAYQQGWEMDYAISSTFRSKLIPNAVLWYVDEADDSDYEEEEEPGEFEELDEDDDDDDDDDEDDKDDDDDDAPKGKKGGRQGGKGKPLSAQGGSATGEEKPECKQQ